MLVERVLKPALGVSAPKMHGANSITRLRVSPDKHPTFYPVILLPFMPSVYPLQYVPTRFALGSQTNYENGLRVRILKEHVDKMGVVEPQPKALSALSKFCKLKLHRKFHSTEKATFDQFMEMRGYTGAKKERYLKAWDDYLKQGQTLKYKNSFISAFLKDENQPASVAKSKQPRVVQSRDYTYALQFGMFLSPIEKQMYRVKGLSKGVRPTSTFGKGHCPLKRAKTIQVKMSQFSRPEIVMFDLTGFDSTIKAGLLKIVHELYRSCNNALEFQQLMEWQLKTRGFIGDFTYTVGTGGRCSGDFDTSLGNAYIMAAVLAMYCEERGFPKWDMYCDGDDTLLFLETGVLDHSDITNFYRELGMILRVEGVAHAMEEIKWCQCTPVFVRGKYRMVPNYQKKISHLLSSPKMSYGYLRSLAANETLLSNGIPILGAFARCLDRSSTGHKETALEDGQIYAYKTALKSYGECPNRSPLQVDYETRVSFAKAFGVSIEEQVMYENLLDYVTLDPTTSGDVFNWQEVHHPDFGVIT